MKNQTLLLQESFYGTFRPKVVNIVCELLDGTFVIARLKNGVRESLCEGVLSEISSLEHGVIQFGDGHKVNLYELGLTEDSIENLRKVFDNDYLAEFVHVQYSENDSFVPEVRTSVSDSFSQSIATMLTNGKEIRITLSKTGLRITYPEGTDLAVNAKPEVIDGICQHVFALDSTIGFEVIHVSGDVTKISKTKIKKEVRLGAMAIFPVLPLVAIMVPRKKKAVTSELIFDEREFELRMSGKGWQFLLPLGKDDAHAEAFRAELAKAVINFSGPA